MNYAYVLQSLVNNRYYYGSTNDLNRRLHQHNSGLSKYTKSTKPFKVVYYEVFETLQEARKREHFFKSGKGREYVKSKISGRAVA